MTSKNAKKMFLIVVTVLMLGVLAQTVLATDGTVVVDPNAVAGTNTANTTNNTNTTNTANTTNRTNTTNSVNQNLPNTGSNSYAVFALIAVCVVSAIYAYKKIRDYNV